MSEQKNRQLVFALISVALPFITVAAVLEYQSIAHASFWSNLGPEENSAGALMGFAEIMQLFLFALIACLIGFALACLSLLSRPKRLAAKLAGYSGLAINGIALMVFVVTWIVNHL